MAFLGWLRRSNYGVKDPTAPLRREALGDAENDELEERVIKKEHDDIEDGAQGFLND